MQFIVIAHDSKDAGALQRRLLARQAHIDLSNEAIKRGRQIFGVALLNNEGNMCGSVMVVDFPTRAELDEWLKTEPYVAANVWQEIQVTPCQVGPSFLNKI